METCIFCKIVNNEIPAYKIYEDKDVVAILDIRPASKHGGHVLVISKKHFELITDLPDELLKRISIIIKRISRALLKFGEGLNILQNNKREAGQAIPHIHFHLIPRFKNDGIKIEKWEVKEYKEQDLEKVGLKIKSLLK